MLLLACLHSEVRKLSRQQRSMGTSLEAASTTTDFDAAATETALEDGSRSSAAPPLKRQKLSTLFASYRKPTSSPSLSYDVQLNKYINTINAPDFIADDNCKLMSDSEYTCLRPLFSRLFCIPASSAPVERVFSQSGLIMRPHRAKMGDKLLEALVFLKCN